MWHTPIPYCPLYSITQVTSCIKITKLLIRNSSPVSCYFRLLGPKYVIQNPEKLQQQQFKALISILILSSRPRKTVSFLHVNLTVFWTRGSTPGRDKGSYLSFRVSRPALLPNHCHNTALQVVRSRVRFPLVSLEFLIDTILPAALWPGG